jgi:hypothetical protein
MVLPLLLRAAPCIANCAAQRICPAYLHPPAAETDLDEMRAAIAASLISLTGARGWHIELVGGSRRQQRPAADASGGGGGGSSRVPPKQHHDADFMVTHHSHTWGEDLIGSLRDELIARRRILPADTGAMCMLQQNRAADIEAKLMDDLTGASGELRSNVASDRCCQQPCAVYLQKLRQCWWCRTVVLLNIPASGGTCACAPAASPSRRLDHTLLSHLHPPATLLSIHLSPATASPYRMHAGWTTS